MGEICILKEKIGHHMKTTDSILSCFIPGEPKTKGSWVVGKHGKPHWPTKNRAWEHEVRDSVSKKMEGRNLLEGPVWVYLEFHLLRPKTVKRGWPHVAPDLDKLVRAILDGCTGTAFLDDGQVVAIKAIKIYGDRDPGVVLKVGQLSDLGVGGKDAKEEDFWKLIR